MVKILDKTEDSILVKMPLSLERHVKVLSRGFEVLSASEKKSLQAIKSSIKKDGYISHAALHAKYFGK